MWERQTPITCWACVWSSWVNRNVLSSCLNQAVDFYRQVKMVPFLARALASLGDLTARQGQVDEARRFRAEAKSLRPASGKTQ